MKKYKVLFAILITFLLFGVVYAQGVLDYKTPINSEIEEGSTTLNKSINGTWNFIKVAIQAVAIGVVIVTGIRYMMASADQKADIKKSMTWLVIGAVITFFSTTIIQYIVVVLNDFIN